MGHDNRPDGVGHGTDNRPNDIGHGQENQPDDIGHGQENRPDDIGHGQENRPAIGHGQENQPDDIGHGQENQPDYIGQGSEPQIDSAHQVSDHYYTGLTSGQIASMTAHVEEASNPTSENEAQEAMAYANERFVRQAGTDADPSTYRLETAAGVARSCGKASRNWSTPGADDARQLPKWPF